MAARFVRSGTRGDGAAPGRRLPNPGAHATDAAPAGLAPAVLGLSALAFLAATHEAAARTWNVYADRSGDARTIQDAMGLAAAGDTVLVWPGTYENRIVMRSGVSLVSQAGASRTTLNANGEPSAIDAGRSARVEGILVQGFKITGTLNSSLSEVARTIHVWGSAVVRECVITGNFAMVGGAHLRSGDLRILDTHFFNNVGGAGSPWVSGVSCAGGYLVVERCTFEDQYGGAVFRTEGGKVELRDSVVRNCEPFKIAQGTESVLIYNNLFDRVPYPITIDSEAFVVIRQNTFARAGSQGAALGPALGRNTVVDRNVMTGARHGLWLCCPEILVTCNNSWGNEVNWIGRGNLAGIDGNMSLQPKYCDAVNGDFTVAANSPLLPQNNPCHDQIGAFPQGCDPLAVDASSWGEIKGRYRR
jgi:hypothetical protein